MINTFMVVNYGRAFSTPTSDTTSITLNGSEFETALRLLESEAAGFAKSVIADPAARAEYIRHTQASCNELIALVKQRRITPHEAAQTAHAMRNELMELARAKLTDFFKSLSIEMKARGLPLDFLQEKYAREKYGRAFRTLTQDERNLVWMEIVHSAGRPNKKASAAVRRYGQAGRVFLIASLAYAVYSVITANNKIRQAGKEGVTLAAGAVGAAAGTAAVAFLVSNPAGWVVGVAMFVGAALMGVAMNEVFDYFWPEKT